MKSKIIFLNGCSSAGKTSLVKAIQHLSEEPFLSSGVDATFAALPAKYFSDAPGGGGKADQGVQFIRSIDPAGFPILEIKMGSYARKFWLSVPKIIKQLADDGHNLIIDEAIWEKEYLENYASVLKDHQVFYVKVNCELPILEEREILRGDRSRGMARGLFVKIKELSWNYDLEINTSSTSPFTNAKKILQFVRKEKIIIS